MSISNLLAKQNLTFLCSGSEQHISVGIQTVVSQLFVTQFSLIGYKVKLEISLHHSSTFINNIPTFLTIFDDLAQSLCNNLFVFRYDILAEEHL